MSLYQIRLGGGGSHYPKDALEHGFIGIGWSEDMDIDPTTLNDLDGIKQYMSKTITSNQRLGNIAGQINRFVFQAKSGDSIIMPMNNGEYAIGILGDYYYEESPDYASGFTKRRKVQWNDNLIHKNQMSANLQYSLNARMTVCQIDKHEEEVMSLLDGKEYAPALESLKVREHIVKRLMTLDGQGFEEFVMNLLNTMGFESETTQYVGDGGTDVIGTLDAKGLADIIVRVQVKRTEGRIGRPVIQGLRGGINSGELTCIVTLGEFHKNAIIEANEPNKVTVKLIGGMDIANLVLEHFEDLPEEYRDLLQVQRKQVAIQDHFEAIPAIIEEETE